MVLGVESRRGGCEAVNGWDWRKVRGVRGVGREGALRGGVGGVGRGRAGVLEGREGAGKVKGRGRGRDREGAGKVKGQATRTLPMWLRGWELGDGNGVVEMG